ncbi:hypothetical protein D3C84_813000 [compost metagenome]
MADLLAQLRRELQHTFFSGQVGGHRMARTEGAQLVSRLLTRFGIARADVHGGAGLDIGLGDHFADTAGAAGHQGGAALQGKVVMHG